MWTKKRQKEVFRRKVSCQQNAKRYFFQASKLAFLIGFVACKSQNLAARSPDISFNNDFPKPMHLVKQRGEKLQQQQHQQREQEQRQKNFIIGNSNKRNKLTTSERIRRTESFLLNRYNLIGSQELWKNYIVENLYNSGKNLFSIFRFTRKKFFFNSTHIEFLALHKPRKKRNGLLQHMRTDVDANLASTKNISTLSRIHSAQRFVKASVTDAVKKVAKDDNEGVQVEVVEACDETNSQNSFVQNLK